MNENELKNEDMTEVSARFPKMECSEAVGATGAPVQAEIPERGEETPETEEVSADISDKEASALVSHPMFVHFARGRQGSFHEVLAAFREMLGSSSEMDTREAITAKMTPAASHAVADVALTERQRAIARAAGMSYREYYTILNG